MNEKEIWYFDKIKKIALDLQNLVINQKDGKFFFFDNVFVYTNKKFSLYYEYSPEEIEKNERW
ncbi:MAG: hypothetical protein ACE5RC_00105 [Nitrosopumilus sp.]